MITKEQAIDIVRKFDFFYGQRGGRELWYSKPLGVQERDLANFRRDCRYLREFLEAIDDKESSSNTVS